MWRGLIGRLRYSLLQDKRRVPRPGTDFPAYGSEGRGTTPWLPPLRKASHSPDEAFADFLAHAIQDRAEWIRFNSAELTVLPATVAGLESLRIMELKRNAFDAIPGSIEDLSRLEVIMLPGNRLTAIPATIGRLKRLMVLGLSSNKLESLPEQIGEAASLRELHLGGNQLKSIPESIGCLKDLAKLNLNNNALQTLPRSLLACASLRYLYLHDNPRLGIPAHILGPPAGDVFKGLAEAAEPRTILTWYFTHKA